MNYFYPHTILTNDRTGAEWQLTLTGEGKLGLMDRYGNVRPLVNAQNFTVLERAPVLDRQMGLILELWKRFAYRRLEDGSLNSGPVPVLKEAEEALRIGGFLEENGQPKEEDRMTLAAGAGGMEVIK